MLYLAFDTPNRLPVFVLNLTDARDGLQVAGHGDPAAGPGSLSLEFTRLAQLTGRDEFFDAVDRVTAFFARTRTGPPSGSVASHDRLCAENVVHVAAAAAGDVFTLGANADSLYEYFPKMSALLDGLDSNLRDALPRLDGCRRGQFAVQADGAGDNDDRRG